MIKLSHAPYEGSALKLNLSFKDSFGNFYVPIAASYTLLALNDDKESWTVVDDLYEKDIEPASAVVLTIDKIHSVLNTTSKRKIRLTWTAFVDGMTTDFIDEVDFEIQPRPYIVDPPTPTPVQHYVEVTDVDLQIGTLKCTPREPIFLVKINMPVIITDATIKIVKGEEEIEPAVTIDSTKTKLTIDPECVLDKGATYKLVIDDLESISNHLHLKNTFELAFNVTETIMDIQELSDIANEHTEQIEEINEHLDELDEKTDSTNSELQATNDDLTQLHGEVDEFAESIVKNAADIKEIQDANFDARITAQDTRIGNLDAELRLEIEGLETRIDGYDAKFDEVIADIELVESNLTQKINTDIATLDTKIDTNIQAISNKIPVEASSTNQLADKEYVKTAIIENGGKFIGNFDSVEELPTTGVEKNDYAYIDSIVENEHVSSRYVYTGTEWKFEYSISGTNIEVETAIIDFENWDSADPEVAGKKLKMDNYNVSIEGSTLTLNDVGEIEGSKLKL